METRDKRRLKILNTLLVELKSAIKELEEDEEFQHVMMKLSLDLQKKKKSYISEEES